ncbi:Spore wall maturation protein DIT1 [Teratosphaeria destructans]|uniref:Spore wall maturation protein DIT1 n=1 Tax=Teratosphaeria destructans TaxID=418781 RepID=A0A9W7W5R2_9PEZI|nr:Spore wall maturation protein DIT1 [Teratosphaeria destructans]
MDHDTQPMPGAASTEEMRTCNKVLDIIFTYKLHKFEDATDRLEVGRPKFIAVIQKFVRAREAIQMCLPAFPFKSANKIEKVLGTLPDRAEELALRRLNGMCQSIEKIYHPGAVLTIISDGLVYNDLLNVPDRDTWAYGEALRQMAVRLKCNHISFSRLRDLVNFAGPDELNQITYVANATNFRRHLLNNFGKEDLDIDREIKTNPDTMMTYLGYRRFFVSDLKYIFPLNKDRSKSAYKKDVKFMAKEMLIRGHAFAGAVKSAYPDHLRLSIHHSTGEHKVSISLLETKSEFTTPWHCSVAQLANGEWLSGPKSEFDRDPRYTLVFENGALSHFKEVVATDSSTPSAESSTAKSSDDSLRKVDRHTEASTKTIVALLGALSPDSKQATADLVATLDDPI